MSKSSLTQSRLKELLHYDPETGFFTNRISRGRAKAGQRAGSPHLGYLLICVDYTRYMAHRLAWLYVHGHWPKEQIDHINHDKSDNRLCNLRTVLHQDNGRNQRMCRNNASGITGVSWDKHAKKWYAQIMVDGKHKSLGRFDRFAEAVLARVKAQYDYGFHVNHGHGGNRLP